MNGFYWIYLIMLAFLLAYELIGSREDRRLIYYGGCGFLVLIFTLQDFSVSLDIAEYMRQYTIIPTLSWGEMLTHKFEIGYVLLCRFLAWAFESDRVLLLVISLLVMVPFCRCYEKETEDPMISLMAFVALGMYMHTIVFWRQLVAMAILTYSYRFIRQRKLLPFLLVVLTAMTFQKVAVVFIPLYFVYNIPINKWLLIFCAAASVILSFFGEQIIEFGIAVIYPRYAKYPRLSMGGETLLALLWVITLLSYWLFRDKLEDDRVRLPFLMILIGATLQPICFSFFWWLRIVLFFRVALVPMTTLLYQELFRNRKNKVMFLLERFVPRLHGSICKIWDTRAFRVITLLILFAVLFVWYDSELDGARYIMGPIASDDVLFAPENMMVIYD